MTEYKRPGNRPTKVVLTAAIRADLKTRGFESSPGGTFMARNIGDVRISIHENGQCNVHLPNRAHAVRFTVDQYWAKSILYLAQQEMNREAARMRKEAETVVKFADKVMETMKAAPQVITEVEVNPTPTT